MLNSWIIQKILEQEKKEKQQPFMELPIFPNQEVIKDDQKDISSTIIVIDI